MKRVCPGHGECLEPQFGSNYVKGKTFSHYTCAFNCEPLLCPACERTLPRYLVNIVSNGTCTICSILGLAPPSNPPETVEEEKQELLRESIYKISKFGIELRAVKHTTETVQAARYDIERLDFMGMDSKVNPFRVIWKVEEIEEELRFLKKRGEQGKLLEWMIPYEPIIKKIFEETETCKKAAIELATIRQKLQKEKNEQQ